MAFTRKHLLSMKDVTKDEIEYILENAQVMKHIVNQNSKKTPHLQGKSVVTLFYENSTRTRMSFELAAKYMSASTVNIAASSSSVKKGETLIDTGKTIEMMGTDLIVLRHPMAGAAHLLSQHVNSAVINAGDGMNEHPTQSLLDLYSILEHKHRVEDLKVAIIGDIFHSRVARSNIWALKTMGAHVTLCAPRTMLPLEIEKTGVEVTDNVKKALKDADVVMALRIQKERLECAYFPTTREYSKNFGINSENIKLAKKDVMIMHPGPINRGIELTSELADSAQSVIDEQVQNGMAVRMALLYLMTRRSLDEIVN